MSRRNAVIALFALVVMYQAVQFAFVAKFGEPYPSLSMPPFVGTGTDDSGRIRVTSADVRVRFADGTGSQVTPLKLLEQAPTAHRFSIMAFMFSPREAAAEPLPRPDPTSWRQRLKRLLVPGRVASAERRAAAPVDPETREWLRQRCRQLFPLQEPVEVSFDWYRETYAVRDRPVQYTREPLGIYTVSLLRGE